MNAAIQTLTQTLLDKMNIEYEAVNVEFQDENYSVNIASQNNGSLLIGWRGKNIDALQEILRSLVSKHTTERVRVNLDVENYKKEQEKHILDLALVKTKKVIETGEEALMPPTSSYLRRLVHQCISESEFADKVTTGSIGEGEGRQIQIKLK